MGLFDTWNVTDFSVALANNMVTPGGVVSGSLTFKVTKPMTFRSVSIKVVGKEHSHIAIRRKHGKHSSTSHYHARNNVHKEYIILFGSKGSSFKGELPPGEYNFPFAFAIPGNAPPTIPEVKQGMADGKLHWYVKGQINIPFSFTDSNATAPFTVATAMPISQYNSRQPFSSPLHRANRTCCCCDQGVTTVQMNLSSNLIIFGRDAALEGNVSINNEESKEDVENIVVTINRVCWVRAQGYERVVHNAVTSTTISSAMKAGDGEKRFTFSLSLPNQPNLVSCHRGEDLFYYYELTAVGGGDNLFTINLIASNALDETNRSAPINVEVAGPVVAKGQYPKFVYAPPPGATPQHPQQPQEHFPQPTPTMPAHSIMGPSSSPSPGGVTTTTNDNIYGTQQGIY